MIYITNLEQRNMNDYRMALAKIELDIYNTYINETCDTRRGKKSKFGMMHVKNIKRHNSHFFCFFRNMNCYRMALAKIEIDIFKTHMNETCDSRRGGKTNWKNSYHKHTTKKFECLPDGAGANRSRYTTRISMSHVTPQIDQDIQHVYQ